MLEKLGNLFNKKNPIDEKLERIGILKATMRQSEASTQTRLMISELIQNPSLVNGMKNYGDFGNFLSNQLNNINNTDELQFITELAFFAISKALNKEMHPFNLFDRLVIMYNAEDFIIDTIKKANNLRYEPLSRESSLLNIKWKAEDYLLKMRYHDLFHENKFYRAGSNNESFNYQEFIEISNMINNGQFESKSVNVIVNIGKEQISKCNVFIAAKYSLNI